MSLFMLALDSGSPRVVVRRARMFDLFDVSAPPGGATRMRALEVTVVVCGDVVPWRHPARRELQFGEWRRTDLRAAVLEPVCIDHDLAVLLTKVRQHGVALRRPHAAEWFEPVPAYDFVAALRGNLAQRDAEPDRRGDERNVVLAPARIWYSSAAGRIPSKGRRRGMGARAPA